MSMENIVGKRNYCIMGNVKVADRSSANVPSLSETILRLSMLLRLSLLFFSLRLKNPSVTKTEYGNYFTVNVLSDSHQFY